MAQHEIYAEQLLRLANGYPLFEPSPDGYDKVRVGDVGYRSFGAFMRLFNVFHPAHHPINGLGVPAGFMHLDEELKGTQTRAPLPPGVMCSSSVKAVDVGIGAGTGASAALPSPLLAGTSVELRCSNSRGAALLMKEEAFRSDSMYKGVLARHMVENYRSWLHFAQTTLRRDVQLQDMILVTGCDLTTEWATVTFLGEQMVEASARFHVDVPVAGGLGMSSSIWGSWMSVTSTTMPARCGPSRVTLTPFATTQPEDPSLRNLLEGTGVLIPPRRVESDQCVFLRGFRVKEYTRFLPVLKAAAEPEDLGGPPPPESDIEVSVQGVGYDEENRHDVKEDIYDLVQRSIFDEMPECDRLVVLLHDDDICDLLEPDMDEESDEIPRDNLEELQNMLRHRIARGKIHLLKRDDLKAIRWIDTERTEENSRPYGPATPDEKPVPIYATPSLGGVKRRSKKNLTIDSPLGTRTRLDA